MKHQATHPNDLAADSQDAADLTGLAVVTLDLMGNVAGWSLGAELVTGYIGSDIIDRHFSVFFTEQDQRLGMPAKFVDQARENGHMQCKSWQVRQDGKRFLANILLLAICGADSRLTGFTAIIRDDPVQQRCVERLRQAVELAPNPMVMVNAAGRIVMTNTQAEQLFGYGHDEFSGLSVEMLVPPRFRGHRYGLRALLLAEPWMRSTEVGRDDHYALRKDGSEVAVRIEAMPIGTEEGCHVLSAIFDTSERKQNEQRIYLELKEKELMLGEIHHRVKTNLQTVCSLLDLQSGQISDEASLSLLQQSQHRIKSMALIHEMLYVSRKFADVDFRGFLETLVPSLVTAYAVNPDRIYIVTNYADLWLPIDTAVPCGLLVNELISNALRHAFPAGRHGTISIGIVTGRSRDVVFSVSDDGVGIQDDYQIDERTNMGLHLVTLLAEQIGAELTIRRRDPTCITLRFPISPAR